MAKVMIFTPTWVKKSGELAMRPETRAAVEALEFEGETVWEIGLHNPHAYETHQNVLAQYVRAQEVFLASDCDALLTVEHDMEPRPDGLQLLWDAAAPVAYGVYMLRHGSYVLNAWEYIGDRNLGESLSIMPTKLDRAVQQGVVRVCGVGFGFTLIRRPVLELLPFRPGDGDQFCPDIPFAVDCLRANIESVARFDVPVDHLDGGLRLRALGGGLMDKVTVVANETLNIAVVSATMHLEAGQEYLLPRDVASEMQRAGYVRVCDEDAVQDGPSGLRIIESAAVEPPEKAVRPKTRKRKGVGGAL